jgi:hypothetical protein
MHIYTCGNWDWLLDDGFVFMISYIDSYGRKKWKQDHE